MAALRDCLKSFAFLLAFCSYVVKASGNATHASVVLHSDGKTLLVKHGYNSILPLVAWGKFRDEINSTG